MVEFRLDGSDRICGVPEGRQALCIASHGGSPEFREPPRRFTLSISNDLPAEPGTYRITQGDLENTEAYEGITALHELYRSDYTRLKQAYDLREQRRKEREAALRANPPVPEDIVMHYWKVQPKRRLGNAEGGAQ